MSNETLASPLTFSQIPFCWTFDQRSGNTSLDLFDMTDVFREVCHTHGEFQFKVLILTVNKM